MRRARRRCALCSAPAARIHKPRPRPGKPWGARTTRWTSTARRSRRTAKPSRLTKRRGSTRWRGVGGYRQPSATWPRPWVFTRTRLHKRRTTRHRRLDWRRRRRRARERRPGRARPRARRLRRRAPWRAQTPPRVCQTLRCGRLRNGLGTRIWSWRVSESRLAILPCLLQRARLRQTQAPWRRVVPPHERTQQASTWRRTNTTPGSTSPRRASRRRRLTAKRVRVVVSIQRLAPVLFLFLFLWGL
mmetsp:Transcript_7958/g.29794  ORF Transcript_7958/g.29794 Transcript_7958/m.29794 type:complete len:245 (+) Transcript_7958:2757-3491(+)